MAKTESTPQPAPQPPGEAIDFAVLRGVRDAGGRFLKGAPGPALRHGLRSALLAEQPALAEAHAEAVRAIEADLGTDSSTLERAAVREAARLMLIVDSLGDDLLRNGVLTAKGKNRAALSAYVMVLDRLHKLMGTVGIERRSKQVPTTVASIVAQLQERG